MTEERAAELAGAMPGALRLAIAAVLVIAGWFHGGLLMAAADNTNPTVTLGAPSQTAAHTITGTVTIQATYNDNVGVTSISLVAANVTVTTLTGTATATVGISGSGLSTRTITLSAFSGTGTLSIALVADTARDAAGNHCDPSAASATITIDDDAPTVTLGAPSANQAQSASSVTFTATYADATTSVAAITLASGDVPVTTLTGTASASVGVTGSGTATRTITLSSFTGTGTLSIAVGTGTATDQAGNGASASAASAVINVDAVGPTVTLGAPSATLVKTGSTATIAAAYADSYSGVAAITLANGDVTVTTLSGTATASAAVSGSGTVSRTITLSSFSGTGTLAVTVGAGTATDGFGNSATASAASAVITVDNTGPTVTLGAPSATLAKTGDSVTIAATYADADSAVAGITLANGNVTVTTLSGTATATAAVSGAGLSTRTITLSSFTGTGTLSVTVASGTATDTEGNSATASAASAVITVDNTGPTVTLGAPSATLAKTGDSVTIAATYADADSAVAGVTLANGDVTVTTLSGTATATAAVSGVGLSARTITLSSFSGTGTLSVTVGSGTATDTEGNSATASAASAVITVDNTGPTVTLGAPSATLAKTGDSVTIAATYADANSAVAGITLANGNVTVTTLSGNATAAAAVSGAGLSARTITLSSFSGTGTLSVTVASGTATDTEGNAASASAASAVITVDNTGPTVTLGTPSATLAKTGDSVTIAATYADANSAVAGITLANGNVTVTTLSGTATATAAVSGAGLSARTITLSSFSGTGTLSITVASSTATDTEGNAASASAASAVITVDNTGPTVTLGAPSATLAKTGDSVTIAATYADANSAVAGITLANGNVTVTTLSGTATATAVVSGAGLSTRTITLSSFSGTGTLNITVASGTATDTEGNGASASTASAVITVDNTGPTVTLGAPSATLVKSGNTATITATYADVGTAVAGITLANGNVTVNTLSGTATATAVVSGAGLSTRTITLSSFSGTGTLSVTVASGTATDTAGNAASASSASAVISVDNTAPTVQSSFMLANSPTNAASVTYLVTFSEAVSGVASGAFTINSTGLTAPSVTNVTTSDNINYTVTVGTGSGSGTLQLQVKSSGTGITDLVGNPLSGGYTAGQTYTIDKAAPTAVITKLNADPTSAATVQFLVTFDEPVTGVDLTTGASSNGDFNVPFTALTGVTISSIVQNSSSTYTVTVGTGTSNGSAGATIGLDIKTTATIADLAGNSFGNGGLTGPTYSITTTPLLYLGGGTTTDVTLGTSYGAGSGQRVLAPSTAVSTPLNCQQFTAHITTRPDGTAEQLNVGAAGSLTAAWDNVAGTLTLSGAGTAAAYASAIQSMYYQNSNASPTAGARVIDCVITDSLGGTSPTAHVNFTVDAAAAAVRLALSGNVGAPDTTLAYTQGSGAVAIAPLSTIANTAPVWSPGGAYPNYNPPYIAQMFGTSNWDFNFSFGSGTYIDSIKIAISNPAPSGFGAVAPGTVETIAFTPAPGYSPDYSSIGPPGAYWQYDGQPGDAVYSAHGQYNNGGAPFDIDMAPADNPITGTFDFTQALASGPVLISGMQNANQSTIPLRFLGATPIPNGDAESILRSLAYTNASANPTRYGTQRRITVTVTRAGVTDSIAHVDLTITPVNQAPVLGGPASYAVDENDPLNAYVLHLDNLTASDIDGNGNDELLTLSVGNGILHIANSTGLVVTGNDTATLTLQGALDGSAGALSNALAAGNLTYLPANLFNGADALAVTLNDLGHASVGLATPLTATLTIPITVNAVNQPPTVAVPTTRTVNENTDLVITNIAIADPDVGSGAVQITISAGHGTLTLTQTTGLSVAFSDGEGSGSPATLAALATPNATMTFRGSLTDVGNALGSLIYHGDTPFYGDHDTVSVQVNDLGGTGTRKNASTVPAGVTPSPAGGSNAWITSASFGIVVRYINTAPVLVPSSINPLTENHAITVPVNATGVLRGGVGVVPTYPLLNTPRNAMYTAPSPGNAGTTPIPNTASSGWNGSNLVAWDQETLDPNGLTYVVKLGVAQGALLRSRPSDPVGGMHVIAVPSASDETNMFTQDDLNQGYISYTQNGALSGDDGFVFTVRDDNPLSCPPAFGLPALTDSSQGESAPIVFNITIDRTLPQVILSGAAPVFSEPVPPASVVPVLIDGGAQVLNPSDTNIPRQFAPAGTTSAKITVLLSIPVLTQVSTNPSPAPAGGDSLDVIGIQDSGSVHPGTIDPSSGITPLVYGSTLIGSFTGGTGGVPLVISFNSPDPVLVTTAADIIDHLTFANPSQNPSASPRAVTIQIENGATSLSSPATKFVTVVPYNNPPVLTTVRRVLAVPHVAVPFSIDVGAPGAQTVATVADPDGVASFTITAPPTKGTITATATPGVFTYTAAAPSASVNGITTDQFTVVATDNGLVSDGATRVPASSPPLVVEVVITDTGTFAPVIDSTPPLEVAQGNLLSYTPHVVTPAVGRLGLTPNLSFTLIDNAHLTSPALGFSSADGTTTWTAAWTVPASTSLLEPGIVYQTLGILVDDLANETTAYQSILLRIVQPPTGNN